MGRGLGFISLILALAVGAYLYSNQLSNVTPGGAGQANAIDVTSVRMDLIAIAQAERTYFATNGKYATLGACRELAPSKQESTTYEPSLVCKLLILGCRPLIPDRLLDELLANGDTQITRNRRPNYTYSAETSNTGFRVIADYSGPDPNATQRISVDETLTVHTE